MSRFESKEKMLKSNITIKSEDDFEDDLENAQIFEENDNNVFVNNENGPDFRGVSCFGAAVLIAKMQFGLGVLGLPQTFVVLGFVPGLISLIVLCALTTWTGIVIGRFRLSHPEVYSIGDATYLMFGKYAGEVMGFAFWLYFILASGAALLTISIAFNSVSDHAICSMAWVGVGSAICLVLGLATRTMKALSWCGYIAVTSVFVGSWIVAIACLTQSTPSAASNFSDPAAKVIEAVNKGQSFASISAAIGTQMLSLCGSAGFFTIHAEMRDQTKYTKSLYLGQGFVTLNYIAISCIVYGKVGQYVASPSLGSAGMMIQKIAYGISFPALFFSCFFQAHISAKYALVRILRGSVHLQSNSKTHWITWISMMTVAIGIGLIVAGGIPFFGDLLGLIGSLLGTSFTLIFPGFMSLYELGVNNYHSTDNRLAWLKKSSKEWGLSRKNIITTAERGIKGVVISNHGGRQLDYSRPPLEVLAEARQMLKERNLQDKIELYVDGGIRRGSDIVKALCLGAKGVGIGRPFIYAMASYGEEGVTKLIQILETEVKNNMRLLGVDKIEDLNEDLVDTTNLKFRSPVVNNRLYEGTYEGLSFPLFNELAVEA